jgi:hypothetical protein
MKYGLANYFKPTPKNVQKWLLATKTILATIGTAEFFSGNSKIAFYIHSSALYILIKCVSLLNGLQSI